MSELPCQHAVYGVLAKVDIKLGAKITLWKKGELRELVQLCGLVDSPTLSVEQLDVLPHATT